MRRSRLRSLILLNGVLLAALAAVTLAPSAQGQAQAARGRGSYTMVAGNIIGVTEAAIYIVDAGNMEMVVTSWDRSRREMVNIGYRNIQSDMGRGPTRAR